MSTLCPVDLLIFRHEGFLPLGGFWTVGSGLSDLPPNVVVGRVR